MGKIDFQNAVLVLYDNKNKIGKKSSTFIAKNITKIIVQLAEKRINSPNIKAVCRDG